MLRLGRILGVVALALVGVHLQAQPAPSGDLEGIEGVSVALDGYGITLRSYATDWLLELPDGREIEWTWLVDAKRAPYVDITCRVAGGYARTIGALCFASRLSTCSKWT